MSTEIIWNFIRKIIIILSFIPILLRAQYPDKILMEHTMVGDAVIVARQSVNHLPGFKAKPGIKYRAYIDPNFTPPIPYEDPPSPVVINTSPSQSLNFIITKTAAVAGTNLGNTTDAVMVDIDYFDGLGRKVQQIFTNASPNQKDIINYILYDNADRVHKTYLPYECPEQNQNGQFEDFSNFIANQHDFLESQYGTINKTYGLTENLYESCRLNRVLKQSLPGDAWKLNPSNPAQEHVLSFEYRINSAAINSWRKDNGSFTPIIYNIGELTVEVSKNENQNLNQTVTITYKDKQGRTVMTENDLGSTTHRTMYIYDIFDNLSCILTPMAASPDQPADQEYCYFYQYDDPRHRMTEKKIPGSGRKYFIYDKRDRVTMIQDANLTISGNGLKWYLNSYDDKNRKVMFGIYEHNNSISRQQMQDLYNTITQYNESLNNNYNDIYHGYTKNVPIALSNCCSNEILLVYYYDIYDFSQDQTFDESNTVVNISEKIDVPHTQSLLTGTKVRVMNPEPQMMREWMLSSIYYNKKERPIQIITNNQLIQGREVISTKYTFLGSIEKQNVLHYSVISNPPMYSITESYTYDHRNRQIKHLMEGLSSPVLLSSNIYTPTGSLKSTLIHANANGSTFYPFMQKTDYTYNIRGWLTGINDPDSPPSPENDIFSMKLYFDNNDLTGNNQFNGNISSVKWTSIHENEHYGYSFSYDHMNQLKDALFFKSENGSWYNDNSYAEKNISYDANGNILTLDRYGSNAQKIDQLSYSYINGTDKISHIMDMSGDVPDVNDYPGNTLTNQSYFYDANGNTTKDYDKGISSEIIYNYLNLPRVIDFGNNEIIINYYDANGSKRGKKIMVGSETKPSSLIYCGKFVFDWNLNLMYILTTEGRIVPENSDYRYEYFFKDHLGNTRTTYATAAIGIPQVIEYQHYYPFGLQIEGISYNTGMDVENNYLFNGKELQKDFHLQWYDYGARFYDPQVGRWTTVDPLAEKHPNQNPYLFCNGNPILFMDPDGRDGIITIKGGQINITSNIYLYGAGATKAVAAQYQSDINTKWGGNYSAKTSDGKQSFSVNVKVNVGLYQGKEKNDPFIIEESWNPYNRDNFIEVYPANKRSYVMGGDEGEWRSQGRSGMTLTQDDPAPHELGHLLGLDDRYTDQNGANKGWEKNIMGDSQNGKVEQRNIDGILQDAMKAYEVWSKDKNNAGKEFKYEINPNKENR